MEPWQKVKEKIPDFCLCGNKMRISKGQEIDDDWFWCCMDIKCNWITDGLEVQNSRESKSMSVEEWKRRIKMSAFK